MWKFKFARILLCLLLVLSCFCCFAEENNILEVTASGTCGDNSFWTLYADGRLSITGTGFFDKIDFGDYQKTIRTIDIESGITNVPDHAFEGNHYVTSVNISNTVGNIGYRAFAACLSMETYNVDTQNPYFCNDDYGVLFDKSKTTLIQYPLGSSLAEYFIPGGVTVIGDSSFGGASVEKLEMPNTVVAIEKSAFEYFATKNLEIPSSIKTIEEFAFYGNNINNIKFNEGLESIGSRSFEYSYITDIYIPASVTLIGQRAFDGCSNLEFIRVAKDNTNYTNDENGVLFDINKMTLIQYPIGRVSESYTIPNTVQIIGEFSFWNCRNINSIILSKTAIVKNQAFAYCINLENIYIENILSVIEIYAFNNCVKLKDIYYSGTKKEWENVEIGLNDGYILNANYHYEISYPITCTGNIEAYLNNDLLHIKADFNLKDSIILIAEYANSNIFINATFLPITENKNYIQINKELSETGCYKIFVWQSYRSLRPISNFVTVSDDLFYSTDEYEEIKLLYLVNTEKTNGVIKAIKSGYYAGDFSDKFLYGNYTHEMAEFIGNDNDKLYDYQHFKYLLKIAFKKYYPSVPGHGWS